MRRPEHGEHGEPPEQERRIVAPRLAGPAKLHRKPKPEEEREGRYELPIREEIVKEQIHLSRARQRTFFVAAPDLRGAEVFEVGDEHAEDGYAAQDIHDLHPPPAGHCLGGASLPRLLRDVMLLHPHGLLRCQSANERYNRGRFCTDDKKEARVPHRVEASPARPSTGRSWLRFLLISLFIIGAAACGTAGEQSAGEDPASEDAGEPSEEPTVPPEETPSAGEETDIAAPPEGEGGAAEAEPVNPELDAQLQAILDQTVADGQIPGAMLAVNTPGQQTWYGSSGIADRTTQAPMGADEPYQIASITKTFTAVVALQLAEEGIVDLDAPMTTYLPDSGVPDSDQMTVRMLLNHTTGLYNYLQDPTFFAGVYADPERVWQPEELIEYNVSFPPTFSPPGAAWHYSSANYVTLGLLVEAATGNSHADEIRTRILEPLGMDRTFYPPDEALPEELPTGYFDADDHSNNAVSAAWATSNMVSTNEDMQTFSQALFEGDLLQPETRGQMFEFVPGNGEYDMPDLAYGLGVMRHQHPVGPAPDGTTRPAEASTAYGHIGGYGGFRTAMWHVPERDITITSATNQFVTDPNTIPTAALDATLTARGE